MTNSHPKTRWLDTAGAGDKIFTGLVILAVLLAVPDILSVIGILYKIHPKTDIEEIPEFYGLYALISLLTLIGIAKAVHPFLRRDEDYYD